MSFIRTRGKKGTAYDMMFLFVIPDTPLKEVNNNAEDQMYTAQCLARTCFPFTAYRDNLTNKRDSAIMALSSDGAASAIVILWSDSN